MLITSLRPGDYFVVYNPDETLKGYYRMSSINVMGKGITYRTARCYEWLWCHFVLQTRRSFPRFQYTPLTSSV